MSGLPRATTAPRARGLPGIGSAIDLFRDPYRWWPRQYAIHGPVFRITLPIEGRTWIVIGGRDANAFVATEGHRVFCQAMTYPKAKRVLGTELHPSITEGALQHHLRRQVAPGFSRQAAAPHLGAMAACVGEQVDRWRAGETINPTAATARLGLDCVAIFATGRPLALENEALRRYATVFTGVIATSWPMALMRWPSARRMREGLDRMIERRSRSTAASRRATRGRPTTSTSCCAAPCRTARRCRSAPAARSPCSTMVRGPRPSA